MQRALNGERIPCIQLERMITEKEHLTEDDFQDIYHKHIINMLFDAKSIK